MEDATGGGTGGGTGGNDDPTGRLLGGWTRRFAELVTGPEADLRLDVAALVIGAHARPDLDLDGAVAELDAIAAACPQPSFRAWRDHLFADMGFHGNVDDYYDPDNSFLDQVARRRVGLPITLSVLGMEVGRRLGLKLAGVGMPGHFLLQDVDALVPTWVDPFASGRVLDRAGCEERFHLVNGASAPFLDEYLEPVGPRAILGRMLANLRSIYSGRGDLDALEWVLRLRLAIPDTPLLERRDLARVYASRGRFRDAAEVLEELSEVEAGEARALQAEATALRARMN